MKVFLIQKALDRWLAVENYFSARMGVHFEPSSTGQVGQRRFPRRDFFGRCWVDDGAIARYVTMMDVCECGARVRITAPPAAGSTIELRFSLTDDKSEIIAQAKVVWRAPGISGQSGMMGLSFDTVSERQVIQNYVGAV